MTDEQLHNPNLAPLLDVATQFPKLDALGFSGRDLRALFGHSEFPTLRSRPHQICFLAEFGPNIFQRSLKTRELAALFDVTERALERTLTKGPQDPSPPGRHRAFDDDTERALDDMILDRFERPSARTTKELLK
jgi:hypothetical protein